MPPSLGVNAVRSKYLKLFTIMGETAMLIDPVRTGGSREKPLTFVIDLIGPELDRDSAPLLR